MKHMTLCILPNDEIPTALPHNREISGLIITAHEYPAPLYGAGDESASTQGVAHANNSSRNKILRGLPREYFILVIGYWLLVTGMAFAEKELPVRCTGDSVTYMKEENTIYGKGNVEIGYQDNRIRADNVRVNIKTKEAWAEGRVIVSDGLNVFTADKVYYNFDTGKATVDGIGSSMYPWFARGKQGERISKDLYHVKNGYITTCDYEKPHTRIKAKDLYIYPGDKIVAKHIVFYWGNMPLFYWPYYSRSLKDEESRWIIIPGYNNQFGKYLITGYKMWWDNFLGGRLEPVLRLDWYEKRGLAAGLYARYKHKDTIESLIRSYIIKDKGYKKDGQTVEETRGRFSMDYAQKITTDVRGLMKLNYLSDPDIIADFFRDEFQEEIQTENYINIAKTTPKYQLSLMVKKRFHKFYTDLERLPELTFNLIEQQIGKTNLLYTCNAGIGYLAQRFSEADGGEDYSAARFDTTHQLRYPRKYLGWLNIIPRIGTRQTYWSKRAEWETTTTTATDTKPTPPGAAIGTTTTSTSTGTSTSTTTTTTITTVDPVNTTITKEVTTRAKKELDKGTWRSVYFTGAEFTTKIARVFNVKSKFWDVDQLRHVIEPRLNYVYQHTPTVLSKDLLDFGDLADKDNHFELGLRNKLQTRRGGTAWDLVDLNIGANYYPEKYMEGTEERSFSHITGRLELRPFDWISMDMDANWDQYDRQIDTYNTELVFYKDDKLSFGLGYRYTLDSDKLWTSEINYTINSNWAIRLQDRYEFDSGQMQYQEYILVRDLHCWNVAFCFRDYRNIDETAYFVMLYPKAYPNVPVTFGTTYFGVDDTSKIDFGMD